MPTLPTTPSSSLTVEAIVAVEAAREFRLHPRDRVVAYTAEAAGTRQLFTLGLRGGYPVQVTASEKPVSDPQWSPDGRRLAFVRDEEIWVVEADGSRLVRVVDSTRSRPRAALVARRPSDRVPVAASRLEPGVGHRCAGAPSRATGERAETGAPDRGHGPQRSMSTAFEWSPDGARMAVMSRGEADDPDAAQISIVEVATRKRRVVAGTASHDVGARWLPDGSLLYLSDADGWFQVIRLTADGRDRIVLTAGEREHGEPGGGVGYVALPSPEGARFVHIEVHDGFQDLVVGELDGSAPPKRGRGRPPKTPRTVSAVAAGTRINPWDGVWRSVGWLADGSWLAAVGERETAPQDLWLLPVPGVAPDDARPRQITDSMPAVLRAALAPGRAAAGERVAITARDGLRVEGTLWRPTRSNGQAGRPPRPDRDLSRTAARPASRSARSSHSNSFWSPKASPSSTSTSVGRPATAARSAGRITTSGATPTSST